MKPFIFSLSLLITLAESKNNTAVVKYHPKANGAPVCQDQEFECYLYENSCRSVATKTYMKQNCQYTCRVCQDSKTKFAFPKKYSAFFASPQFKYYSGNYYSGYNGYCCGCYGGGWVGFAGYPGFGGFGIGGFDLLLSPIEAFLGGLGLAIGNGLANLGALLSHGAFNSYGYGFGNNYYCIDYLPGCYQYIPFCYSPLSYYYSCMARYCAVTCGFCIPGSIGGQGLIGGGSQGLIGGGYNPGYSYPQNGGSYQNGGGNYYYPNQQYPYGNQYGNNGYQNGNGYQYGNGYQNGNNGGYQQYGNNGGYQQQQYGK